MFGGGGIVPDVVLPETGTPRWLAQLNERGLLLTWAAGFVGKPGFTATSIDALAKARTIDAAALTDFRGYATSNGVTVPTEAGGDEILARTLTRYVAFARFGNAGYYQLVALTDPAVRQAIDAFANAATSLRP